jgi:hypothetical protein
MRSIKMAMIVPAALALALAMAAGQAVGGTLSGAEQACIKYAGPAAQDECRRQQKASMDAFERERQKKAQQGGAAQKKPDLCFLREGTGERVCPN